MLIFISIYLAFFAKIFLHETLNNIVWIDTNGLTDFAPFNFRNKCRVLRIFYNFIIHLMLNISWKSLPCLLRIITREISIMGLILRTSNVPFPNCSPILRKFFKILTRILKLLDRVANLTHFKSPRKIKGFLSVCQKQSIYCDSYWHAKQKIFIESKHCQAIKNPLRRIIPKVH